MGLSDGIQNMRSTQYSFEQINGGTRYDMTRQFGHSGVKARLYQKKYQQGDESIKDSKEYQQNLLANNVGYSTYRAMGEALKDGRLSNHEVLSAFRELKDAGHINEEHFLVEKKGTLADQVKNIKKHSDPRTTFTTRKDIQQKLLRNEISSYAAEQGFLDENDNPDALLFLEAVESGDYRDSRAEALLEEYKQTFDSLGYAGSDYENFKDSRGLNFNKKYGYEDISKRIIRRF